MELQWFDVNVNYPGGCVILKVSPSWDVAKVKQEVANRTRIASQDFKIVFAGQTLGDNQTLLDLGLEGYSTLHCIRSAGVEMVEMVDDKSHRPKQKVVLIDAVNVLGAMSGNNGKTPDEHRFYVYCKNPCRCMTPGKLRVRCADCRSSSFELTRGPGGWEDVLLPRRLHGKCNNEACGKSDAEFFFKCSLHPTEDNDDSVALHMIRANTFKVECAVCTTVLPQVVVFSCEDGHSMCVECFIEYCTHQLLNRQFIQDPSGKGYTIQCPAGCQGSEVTEIHHFRLMGKNKEGQDLYSKYQKFATEECILQMGGLLCPNRGCGEGLLPEVGGNRIQCPEPSGCGFVFCRDCKRSYHNGPCQHTAPAVSPGQAYLVDPHNLERARWIEATERFIQNNTNIKPCPRCKVPIEKNGGCMHMVCSRMQCRFEWCWICGTQWDRNCQSSHWFG